MEVICFFCEKTRNANDCWCCIEKGSRHYECKWDAECEKIKEEIKIRKSVKIQIPNVKPLSVKTEKPPVDLIDIDVKISDQPLQKMEIEDWKGTPNSGGLLSSFLSIFSISLYTKIKNE